MKEIKEQKINDILKNSLKVLASKGYENATIADISKASNVSRGILHYYFSDKEDLVSRALAFNSINIVKSALRGVQGKTAEEMADNIVKAAKESIEQNPDFMAFLFEMWCAGRRSEKIKRELINCSDKISKAIKDSLDIAIQNKVLEINQEQTAQISKSLLALIDGIAFEMLISPTQDKQYNGFWVPVKTMVLAILKP
ncbi:MAG: TetR/AcrR family transcriptional regulator [Thermoproteota archaeon]|nr:TetR/AcrR family transcriptional regulator [Thermoproteota archaeon]